SWPPSRYPGPAVLPGRRTRRAGRSDGCADTPAPPLVRAADHARPAAAAPTGWLRPTSTCCATQELASRWSPPTSLAPSAVSEWPVRTGATTSQDGIGAVFRIGGDSRDHEVQTTQAGHHQLPVLRPHHQPVPERPQRAVHGDLGGPRELRDLGLAEWDRAAVEGRGQRQQELRHPDRYRVVADVAAAGVGRAQPVD